MYKVIWPSGKKTTDIIRFAGRLDSLEGKTICFLWNRLFCGDQIYMLLKKELENRYSKLTLISYEPFGAIHGKDELKVLASLPKKLKQYNCDAVIVGMGC